MPERKFICLCYQQGVHDKRCIICSSVTLESVVKLHVFYSLIWLHSLKAQCCFSNQPFVMLYWTNVDIVVVWKLQACQETEQRDPYGLSDSPTTCEGDVKIVSAAWNMNSILRVWTKNDIGFDGVSFCWERLDFPLALFMKKDTCPWLALL